MTTITKEERQQIANTIISQIGGRRFMAMTGVKQFIMNSQGGVEFKIGRNKSKANHVMINYNYGKDLYDVAFGKIRADKYTTLKTVEGVYCDMLEDIFEDFTGLYTRL